MPYRPRVATVAVPLAAMLLIGSSLAGCGSSTAPAPDPASLVPASAPVYLAAVVTPQGTLETNAKGDARLLTQQRDVYGSLLGLLSLGGAAPRAAAVKPWLGERAGLFLTRVAPAAVSSPTSLLGLLRSALSGSLFASGRGGAARGLATQGALVIDVTDAAKARAFLRHRGLTAPRESYLGVRYASAGPGESAALLGHFMLLGGTEAVREAIETEHDGDALSTHSAYGSMRANAPGGALASLYVDAEAPLQAVSGSSSSTRTGSTSGPGGGTAALQTATARPQGSPQPSAPATTSSSTAGAPAAAASAATESASAEPSAEAEGAEASGGEGQTAEASGAVGPAGGTGTANEARGASARERTALLAAVRLLAGPGASRILVSLVPQVRQIRIDLDAQPAAAPQAPSTSESEASATGQQLFQSLPEGSWVALGAQHPVSDLERALALLPGLVDGAPGASHPAGRHGASATPSQALAALAGSLGGIASFLAPVERVVRTLEAHRSSTRRIFAGWVGPAAAFVSGASLLELEAGLVISSRDTTLSREAVTRLQTLLAGSGTRTRPLSLAGAEAAFAIPLAGLPAPVEVAAGAGKFVVGFGVAPVQAALAPTATIGSSSAYRAAVATLGEGLQPRLILDTPALVSFMSLLGVQNDPGFATVFPYLRRVTTITAGYGRLGTGTRTVLVLGLG